MDVSELTQSLSGYSSTVDSTSTAIANATKPVAMILIGIAFLIELDSWWKYMKQEGGGLTGDLWMEVTYKYLIAVFLVGFSNEIFGAITELVNIIIRVANGVVPASSVDYTVDIGKVKGWFFKNVFKLVGGFVEFLAKISVKLITMMRFFQMYLLKSLGPLLVAFFVSDATRAQAINILKYFAAAAFQGIILFIVVRLYPALVTDDLLKIESSGILENWVNALSAIAKGVIFLFMLFGSQRVAKNLIGVM